MKVAPDGTVFLGEEPEDVIAEFYPGEQEPPPLREPDHHAEPAGEPEPGEPTPEAATKRTRRTREQMEAARAAEAQGAAEGAPPEDPAPDPAPAIQPPPTESRESAAPADDKDLF